MRRGPSADVVEVVLSRCGGACEVCSAPLEGERGYDWALHHRRGRDGAQDSHTAPNLIAVHGRDNVTACHGRIHRNVSGESRRNGWLITRIGIQRNPLEIPVLVGAGSKWVYLSEEGLYVDSPTG